MDNKSFGAGLIVASAVWIFTLGCVIYMQDDVLVRDYCNLTEDDVIDTEFEVLMVENRVKAYERGYYSCLQDTRPDIYTAYMSCIIQLRTVHGDSAFNSIVDAECAQRNLNAEDKEYLCTLLLD